MAKKRKKILITGVAGFVGAHFLQHVFENTDWDVVGVASWRHMGTPERVEQVLSKNPEWKKRLTIITHDLAAPLPERTRKRIGQCEYIVNIAADSHVDRSMHDPVPFITNNVGIAITMLEFAREYKPDVFIQVSTDEVYGVAPRCVNHIEWSSIVPSNPYSASKACQEAIAISYWRTFGVPLVITNTMNNFGEMQDTEKFVAKIIRLVSSGQKVPIHAGKKMGSRYYLHARNHADAILYILRKLPPTLYVPDKQLLPDRYNVVGDIEMDNLSMAKMIAKIIGKPLRYELVDFHSSRPGHDYRYALDGSKIKKKGWKPPVDFKESMARYVRWTLNHKQWL